MSAKENDPLELTTKDLRVAKAVLSSNETEMTLGVMHSIWRWFQDVDLALPLPVMPLEDKERRAIAKEVVDEMLVLIPQIAAIKSSSFSYDEWRERSKNEITQLDALWKEFAGCYSDLLNSEIPEIPAQAKEEAQQSFVAGFSEAFHLSEDEVRNLIKTDPSMRLMLRRAGLNPDEIN